MPKSKKIIQWVFIIFILLGAGIRFWKMGHGLPHFFYSDEGIFTYIALNMGGEGLNSHYFIHPTLFLYLLLFLDGVFILSGMLTGIFQKPGDGWQLYLSDPTIFYVMGRYASAVFGILTIAVTYFIGKKAFNKEVGLMGSFFLAFSLLHVQWSQLGYNDVPLTFFTTLAFLFAFMAVSEGRLLDFVLSGLASGLAASTKYQGFVALLWGPLAGTLWAMNSGKCPVRELWGKRCLLFLVFLGVGFTLGTPFWLLDFPHFKNHLIWHWTNLKGAGQLGYEGRWNWIYYLVTVLPYGLGLPVAICGVLGMILLAARFKKMENLFFISFPILFWLAIGVSRIRVAKYILPVFPFLCLAAAHFLAALISKLTKKPIRETPLILLCTSLLVVVPGFRDTVRHASLRTFPDTRELALAWVKEHVPLESKILQTSYVQLPSRSPRPEIKRLDPTFLNQRVNNRSSLRPLEYYRTRGFEYVILDEWHLGIALVEAARDPVRRKTVERYQNFLEEFKKSATLLATYSPYREENVPFDMENVELPSRSLGKMKSTGPTVWIYKLSF